MPAHWQMAMSPDAYLEQKQLAEVIDEVLGQLSPRQRDVIDRRYGLSTGEKQTLSEIGRRLRLTGQRVRMIEMNALRRLRHPLWRRRLMEAAEGVWFCERGVRDHSTAKAHFARITVDIAQVERLLRGIRTVVFEGRATGSTVDELYGAVHRLSRVAEHLNGELMDMEKDNV